MSLKDRQQANRDILNFISDEIKRNPEMRFTQILYALGINDRVLGSEGISITDNIYEESDVTLAKVLAARKSKVNK